jgi:hypothetical protein
MSARLAILFIPLLLLCDAAAQTRSRRTVMQGYLMADRPTPFTQGIVTATRVDIKGTETVSVQFNGAGFYRFEGLAPGQYQLCALSVAGEFVDPCQWRGARIITLRAGERLASVPILIHRARMLKVFVAVAGAFIDRAAAAARADLVVGVRPEGGPLDFRPAAYIATSADTREYRVAVPIGVSITLDVKSKQLRMLDARGQDPSISSQKLRALDNDTTPFEARFTVIDRVAGGRL